jgi:16S rRNA (guanine966-N2)-methyltransferase
MRITGGAWRGRNLDVPRGIRPTTELARKAAFDILGEGIARARVLDACAGSGAYGLEALSRGAAHATFVEADRGAARVLRENVERLGAKQAACIEEMSVERFALKGEESRRRSTGHATVARADAPARSPSKESSFDVVFHDPPFEADSLSDLSLLLALVRPGGWLFHERGDGHVLAPGGVAPADVRRYGRTRFLVYRR